MSPVDARRRRRQLTMVVLAAVLVIAVLLSLRFGSRPLTLTELVEVFQGDGSAVARAVVLEQRVPRTILGILCGAALAVAGSLMQSLTRNPLAEPGLLGINAGASFAVVVGVVVFGVVGIPWYLLLALLGAGAAGAAVFILGRGASGSVARLTLAGVAVSAALAAINEALILMDQRAFDEFRFWVAGSPEGRGTQVILISGAVILVGLIIGLLIGPSLHALTMGEQTGIALGVNLPRTQTLTLVAVALLAGASTAAMGPVAFVGLAVPYVVRQAMGNDVRWVSAGCLLLGPAWLLGADVLARVVTAPAETPVGVVAILAGAPLFVALITRRKIPAL